jgi:phosphonate transport system substrate-binding protein
MDRVRVGTLLAPSVLPLYEAAAAAIGDRLGIPAELVVETDYSACREDRNDVCFVCSLPYVTFEREGLDTAVPVAAPVLAGSRYEGRPIYFSDVIVRHDSPFRSFMDLRGASWAYNEPLSHSGYGVTRHHLVTLGETSGFFGEVIEAGYHQTAIELVRAGTVDASAIDSQVLEIALRDIPGLADDVRVIDSLGPSTIQPAAVSRRLDPTVRSEIQAALLHLDGSPEAAPALAHALVERFVPVEPSDYDDIREMLDACEAAGFMELR